MAPAHSYQAIRYIELNPTRAGLVQNPLEYPWSTAAYHAGLGKPLPGICLSPLEGVLDAPNWAEYLAVPESESDRLILRSLTARGRRWNLIGQTELGAAP